MAVVLQPWDPNSHMRHRRTSAGSMYSTTTAGIVSRLNSNRSNRSIRSTRSARSGPGARAVHSPQLGHRPRSLALPNTATSSGHNSPVLAAPEGMAPNAVIHAMSLRHLHSQQGTNSSPSAPSSPVVMGGVHWDLSNTPAHAGLGSGGASGLKSKSRLSYSGKPASAEAQGTPLESPGFHTMVSSENLIAAHAYYPQSSLKSEKDRDSDNRSSLQFRSDRGSNNSYLPNSYSVTSPGNIYTTGSGYWGQGSLPHTLSRTNTNASLYTNGSLGRQFSVSRDPNTPTNVHPASGTRGCSNNTSSNNTGATALTTSMSVSDASGPPPGLTSCRSRGSGGSGRRPISSPLPPTPSPSILAQVSSGRTANLLFSPSAATGEAAAIQEAPWSEEQKHRFGKTPHSCLIELGRNESGGREGSQPRPSPATWSAGVDTGQLAVAMDVQPGIWHHVMQQEQEQQHQQQQPSTEQSIRELPHLMLQTSGITSQHNSPSRHGSPYSTSIRSPNSGASPHQSSALTFAANIQQQSPSNYLEPHGPPADERSPSQLSSLDTGVQPQFLPRASPQAVYRLPVVIVGSDNQPVVLKAKQVREVMARGIKSICEPWSRI